VTGYNFGGSGLNFNLPDLRGKVIVTKSTETEFSSLGLTGGEKTHVLTVPEMPNHAHQVWANSAAGSNATPKDYSGPGTGVGNLYPTTAVGGGAAHNNLQPFIVMNHIIKY
jgi:microcystin-dependent protein